MAHAPDDFPAGDAVSAPWPPALDSLPAALIARLATVRLLCLDVDGVLSDGGLYFLEEDQAAGSTRWALRFSVRDGVGIKRLQASGIQVAILSEGSLPAGQARARTLGITHAYFGLRDKVAQFSALCETLSVSDKETAFMGDELSDLPLLRRVGLSATVADAVSAVKREVNYTTQRRGGDGAVRELCELILAAQERTPGLNSPKINSGPIHK